MNKKTSYNITKISVNSKLKKLYKKLNSFNNKKYVKQTINFYIQLQYMNIDLSSFECVPKINYIILSYFRKNRNLQKQKYIQNSKAFITFLLHLSEDSDFHKHLLDLFHNIHNKNSKFDKIYHFEIIEILGNSIDDTDILFHEKLSIHVLKSIKNCNYKKLSYFLPYLTNFHQDDDHTLLPKYDYVMIRYVKYITKLKNVEDIIGWLGIILKLMNKLNLIYFFKYSGYEQLTIISERYPNNYQIRSKILLFKIKMKNSSYNNTTSLHQLCKYHNSLSSIKFMLQNTDIDYNKKDYLGKTPFHIAIFKSNKSIIELFISSGVNLNIHYRNKNIMDIIHSNLYIYNKTDPLFVNVIQKAFIRRTLNDKLIDETIAKFKFYDDINSIIKQYVDPVSEYFKNEPQINNILK